ncbi:hypothetical protein LVD17_23075 [Fulvivirga ulvae]|uniref:hypothetical protein n=1 Tax=Fulvivirga ulvae TaxID=2904245 RepID=UPI001F372DAF|nr:hypothetical protein [Fulvivirga ulvae]UII31178.1 hypothetical protein LVD17_23075 [Fulvivirga ulvae]
MLRIIDLHNHPSMKPYNNDTYRDDVDLWDGMEADAENYYRLNGLIRGVITETARDSQAQMREWVKGDLSLCICALHPTERGWFVRSTEKKGRIRKWLLGLLLREDDIASLGAALTGFPIAKVRKVIKRVRCNQGIDYFTEPAFGEYSYLRLRQGTAGPWGFTYKIVNNYDEYQHVRAVGNQLAMIISVEGGHSLTTISKGSWFNTPYDRLPRDDKEVFKASLQSNIRHLKGTGPDAALNFEHTPFFVTLVHMYNNLLAGHAKSYSAGHGIVPGMDDLLYQAVGLDDGITDAGWLAINQLLDRSLGRRVLIDVKHLSMRARQEYYEFVADKRDAGDAIPVIASHAAVNGHETNDVNRKDTYRSDKSTYLSCWSINLSNEDIRAIHASDGIIGLVVHEGRTPGGKTKKNLKKLKKCIAKGGKQAFHAQEELAALYCQLILSNIFQIVLAVGNRSAWDIIALGSDYDGIMDLFNCYPKVGDFHQLIEDIGGFLKAPQFLKLYKNDKLTTFGPPQLKDMMYGLSPADIMQKIAHQNAEIFLSKYFTDEYLSA